MSTKISPRITVITSTYNCAEELKKTAASIRSQSYKNLQWIVVDGGSCDHTIEIIQINGDIISNWLSEPDKGIYDAWNKACKFIDGKWVIFLGAGDIFDNDNALRAFWDKVPEKNEQYGIIYGDVYMCRVDGSIRYLNRKPILSYWEHGRIALPNHQGVFHRANLFRGEHTFDASLKIAGDTKFMMELLLISEAYYVDIILSRMQDEGVSNKTKSILIARKEIQRICKELNIKVPVIHKLYANIRDYVYLLTYSIMPLTIIKMLKKRNDTIRNLRA